MPIPLPDAMALVRELLTDLESLVDAKAAGRRRGQEPPAKSHIRPVEIKGTLCGQVIDEDPAGPRTQNYGPDEWSTAVAELSDRPFGNWRIETTTEIVQIRVTKRGEGQIHRAKTSRREMASRSHDRQKERLIDPEDPLFAVLGAGADKRRQVEAFLRLAESCLRPLIAAGKPLTVVDLGCGNAYLAFAFHRWLHNLLPDSTTIGIESRDNIVRQAQQRADAAGLTGLTFEAGLIAESSVEQHKPDVVLALHACDTATDDALATAVRVRAKVVLAAPCCHHDVQKQWSELGHGSPGSRSSGSRSSGPRSSGAPSAAAGLSGTSLDSVLQHAILRERFADVVTDTVRAQILEQCGYKTSVVEFVDSKHTPRNAMIRAVLADEHTDDQPWQVCDVPEVAKMWQIKPALLRALETDSD